MPWKTSSPVDLRFELITRLKRGERMTDLCREYDISRKTGHKFKARYLEFGVSGLDDRPRAPKRIPHKTAPELMELFVAERLRHPTWGARKLKDVLERKLGRSFPSASAIQTFLTKKGLIKGAKQRPRFLPRTDSGLREALAPNDVWCVDYKGQFRLGNGRYCYPLTATDQFSRYILECEAMPAIHEDGARDVFDALFREKGLPFVIRSDNGVPFASSGLAGLTKLSAYWMRLGILHDRIRPAHPEENGRHERMHRTLKRETTRPPRVNLLQQQEVFDKFVSEFNTERPHEGLGMRRPAEAYKPSPRLYPSKLPEPKYLTHDDVLRVDQLGCISMGGQRHFVGRALTGQPVGIREEDDGRLLVTFMELDLGHFEAGKKRTPKKLTPITSDPSEAT